MTREHYEHTKRRLEEQLRAGMALLQSAHDAQIRALDVVWMLNAEKGGAAPIPAMQEPPSLSERPRRHTASEVESDVNSLFWRLPDSLTRSDVCEVLGYEPDRGILYRVLQKLVHAGYLVVDSRGEGKRATVYRKTDDPDEPREG